MAEITPFDNNLSILYKWSNILATPVSYLLDVRTLTTAAPTVVAPTPVDVAFNTAIANTVVGVANQLNAARIEDAANNTETVQPTLITADDMTHIPLPIFVNEALNEGLTLAQIYGRLINTPGLSYPDDVERILSLLYFNALYPQTPLPLPTDELEVQPWLDALAQLPDGAGIIADMQALVANIQNFYNTIDVEQNWLPTDGNTVQALLRQFITWNAEYRLDTQTSQIRATNINDIQALLSDQPVSYATPLTVTNVTLAMTPQLRQGSATASTGLTRPIDVTDGVDIFNLAVPSNYVPYVQYNSVLTVASGTNTYVEKYHKVYEGETAETAPNYNYIIPSTGRTGRPYYIHTSIWSGDGNVLRATRDSYVVANHNLMTNRLTVDISVEDNRNQAIILNRLQNALPLVLGSIEETRIGGNFSLYQVSPEVPLILDIPTFLDVLLNDEVAYNYLYIEEFQKSSAEKRRLTVHFRSVANQFDISPDDDAPDAERVRQSSVTATLAQHFTESDTTVDIETNEGIQAVTFANGTPYIVVNIIRADSRDVAQQFMGILNRILGYYATVRANVAEYYAAFGLLPVETTTTISPASGAVDGRSHRRGAPGSKIRQLRDIAPDLFVSNYPRVCQCPLQPLIIPVEERDAWINKTFIDSKTGLATQRQVLPFPRDTPKWLFVCPDDNNPYPGVKRNKTLSNKNIYPYIPCCSPDDQTVPGTRKGYNKYYNHQEEDLSGAGKAKHRIKTNKRLQYGSFGEAPNSVAQLLSQGDLDVTVNRLGVSYTVNSLLECVLIAINDPEYFSTDDIAQRQQYISRVRSTLAETTLPALLKQEMYDFTDDEIITQLVDPARFLDPALFYRALEERFNVTIYTFTLVATTGTDIRKATSEDTIGALEVPRAKLFSARPLRLGLSPLGPEDADKSTVLIFKHWGGEADNLEYPQCELLITGSGTTTQRIFDDAMQTYLHEAFLTMNKVYSWNYSGLTGDISTEAAPPLVPFLRQIDTDEYALLPRTGGVDKRVELVPRINIYSRINFGNLFDNRVVAQVLDDYGKLRAVIVQIDADTRLTATMPPSQPLNVPQVREPVLTTWNTAVRVFGEPSSITRTGPLITGVWFSLLGIPNGMYVPLVPTEEADADGLEALAIDPVFSSGPNQVARLRWMRRNFNILLQLVLWGYLVSGQEHEEFADQWFLQARAEPGPNVDSATIYDMSGVPRKLPPLGSTADVIEYLAVVAPTLIRDNKYYLYSPKFAEGIRYYLKLYDQTHRGLPRVPPPEITGMYQTQDDFTHMPHVAILIGEEGLRAWLKSNSRNQASAVNIKTSLDISYGLQTEPYLYMTNEGNIYMIQNVQDGNIYRAAAVALEWTDYNINPGFSEPPIEGDFPAFAIFGISKANQIVLLDNQTRGADRYIQLLSYGPERFAAMLLLY